jgi:hypothetical protein
MEPRNAAPDSADFEFPALQEAKNYRRALICEFSRFLVGNVIEIGAGIGQMTEELRKISTIRQLLPIEPEASFCKKHRENHPGSQTKLMRPPLGQSLLVVARPAERL